ncbi:MAG: VanZ family protein [Porticoccaceae bacterium]
MNKSTYYRVLFWLCAVAAVIVSLVPTTGAQLFDLQDKVAHVVLYASLYFIAVQAYGRSFSLLLLAIMVIGFGLSLEIAQSMTSYRYGDIWDFVANSIGVIAVWLLLLMRGRPE